VTVEPLIDCLALVFSQDAVIGESLNVSFRCVALCNRPPLETA
jgi:hypothetical protein